MGARRHHEQPVRLIHVQSAIPPVAPEGGVWCRHEYRIDPCSGSWTPADASSVTETHAAVLLELDRDQALLTAPSATTLVSADGSGRLPAAIVLAAAAERQLQRDLDRLRRCERFVVLADLLATAESRSDVFGALVEHLPEIVAAWKAFVLWRALGHGRTVMSSTVGGEELGLAGVEWGGPPELGLPVLAQLDRDTLYEAGDPVGAFGRSVFARTQATRLACAGIGADALAVVADRRSGRDFSPQDWDLLRVASRQAAAALDRLG